MKTYIDTGMDSRRKLYNDKYIDFMLEVITPEGKSVGLENPIGFREVLWHCFPLFEKGGEYAKRANSIIRNTEFKMCHFMPMNFTQLLKRYSHLLEPDVTEKLKSYILGILPHGADDRIHIAMYNDNFAGMAIYTLLVAGEMFGLSEYFDIGLEKLKGVRDYFYRCGAIMEYCSCTYTPIDTLCYAEMANHIENKEAREIALMCEERMWVEIATHYHPETSRMAGPYSRSYAIDMVGHPHLFSGLAWYVFGDRVFSNPILDLFKPHKKQMMHGGLENLTLPNIAWIINTDYHCPKYLEQLAFSKIYPYETEYITECIPSNYTDELPIGHIHEYPGIRGRNYTYMTEEFAMGTAFSQFHEGAISDSFTISYRNKDNASRLYDTGVIVPEFIFNDRLPGGDNEYAIFGKINYTGFRDEGRKFGLQDKGVSIVAYKAKPYELESVTSVKLSIMIPVHFFDDIKIYTADGKAVNLPYTSGKPETVYVNIHKSYFAFIPMEITDLGTDIRTKIEKAGDYILISHYNYHGDARSFNEKELILLQNGFVCVSEANCGSIKEFMDYASDYSLKDAMEKQESAWFRKIHFKNSKADLQLMFSPMTDNVFVSTINKKPTGMHVIRADGLDLNMVPFL
ncbi:MAG: hypothetical protein J7L77_05365 [Clostridiales bacterium]|nr:hypothetical protein [Clostridiales bacterium]